MLACGSSDANISVFTARTDGGWDTSSMDDEAHPVGVRSVSWAPSTAPGALVCSALLHPLHNLCSGGCDNTVKLWKLHHGTSLHTFSVYMEPAFTHHGTSLHTFSVYSTKGRAVDHKFTPNIYIYICYLF